MNNPKKEAKVHWKFSETDSLKLSKHPRKTSNVPTLSQKYLDSLSALNEYSNTQIADIFKQNKTCPQPPDLGSALDIENELFSEDAKLLTFVVEAVIDTDDAKILKFKDQKCILSGSWRHLNILPNMEVTILQCLCCNTSSSLLSVDDNHNILVIKSDIITVTTLCNSLKCIHRPLLNKYVMDIRLEYSHPSLIIGTIIHSVLQECLIRKDFSIKFLICHIRKLITENIKTIYACNLTDKMCLIECMNYVKEIVSFGKQNYVAIEIEKKIISQLLGLRGSIDALLDIGDIRVPLEIKTGKNLDPAHMAQIILYCLIIREKYEGGGGILYYAKLSKYINVKLIHNEVRSLLILRNELTIIDYMIKNNIETRYNFLGEMKFKAECRCSELEYCKKIEKLYNLDNFKGTFLREQWEALNEEEKAQSSVDYFECIFKSQSKFNVILELQDWDIPMQRINAGVNEKQFSNLISYVDIYSCSKMQICKGKIVKIEQNLVYLELYDNMKLYSFSLLYVAKAKNDLLYKTARFSLLKFAMEENSLFDKLSLATPSSLSQKVYDSNLSINRYDSMLSLKEKKVKTEGLPQLCIPDIYKDEFLALNDDQRSALHLSLNCERYRLIHGFPGTGKSHLIVLLIKILAKLGKKVLLICFTNLALTNILKHLTVRYYRALKCEKEFKTVSELKEYFDIMDLVCGTCFSFSDVVFINRKFDFCIVDEASQQHLLLTMMPISISKRFILVGDHLQLKPLVVKSKVLGISLFEYLLKKGDVSELRMQYRMNSNIMKLSNTLFYDNKMLGNSEHGLVKFIDSRDTKLSAILSGLKIGIVLCYFNMQVSAVKKLVNCDCIVETVDRFQGSEGDEVCVIFDPVIDNDIMKSRERLNVALTRARKKLILVGDLEKMRKIKLFNELLEILRGYS